MSADERLTVFSRIEEMLGKDWSYNRIQKETGIPKFTIRNRAKAILERGTTARKEGSGRPFKFSHGYEKKLWRRVSFIFHCLQGMKERWFVWPTRILPGVPRRLQIS